MTREATSLTRWLVEHDNPHAALDTLLSLQQQGLPLAEWMTDTRPLTDHERRVSASMLTDEGIARMRRLADERIRRAAEGH